MANALYGKFKDASIEGAGVNWASDTVKALLVNTTDPTNKYTVSINVNQFLSDVKTAGATTACRIATATLAGKSSALGTANATSPVTWTSVAAGLQVDACILYIDTGVEATSKLIAYYDTATGLPIIPDGNNVNMVIDTGTNKLWTI